jgi:hypothetical protein
LSVILTENETAAGRVRLKSVLIEKSERLAVRLDHSTMEPWAAVEKIAHSRKPA